MAASPVVELSREVRDAGWELHQQLKRDGFPLDAMFWAEFDEKDWRIYLATHLFDQIGGLATVARLREELDKLPTEDRAELTLADIYLTRPTDPFVSRMRQRYGTIAGDRRLVRRTSLAPDEGYIYELN